MTACTGIQSASGPVLSGSLRSADGSPAANRTIIATQILLQGRVQGLGVRPAIAKLAIRLKLHGSVTNTPDGVLIHLEGLGSELIRFQALLAHELPPQADVLVGPIVDVPVTGRQEFTILAGADTAVAAAADVPTDVAMCAACAHELTERSDRRFGYAFSSCTQCGPRYTIIRSMPYERRDTSMIQFDRCPCCEAEFCNFEDRRFHAQTVACQDCGPQLWLESASLSNHAIGAEAIAAAAKILRAGGILAMKGLGGYQLVCDAANEAAVQRLRESKRRHSKPFAVMIHRSSNPLSRASEQQAAEIRLSGIAQRFTRPLSDAELAALTLPANPIVIMDNLKLPSLAINVNPGMNSLGILFPTTPLHALLLNEADVPIVVTSCNQDSDPIIFDEAVASKHPGGLADAWLHHDRPIERPLDDSVVRLIAGQTVTIRAGRGIAPLRLLLQTRHSILAVGGEQKVACAFSNGRQAVLGPHLGDMCSLEVRRRFLAHTEALKCLYGADPAVIAHDLHPDYFTTRWAAGQARRTIGIQHHHAHVVSGMVQHGLLDQKVLGVAFDGTGYGTDGTIWGGEFLLTSATEFQRVASLRPFVLPGGDAAIREPWRVAVALLNEAIPEMTAEQIAELLHRRAGATPDSHNDDRNALPAIVQIRRMQRLVNSGFGALTSSMGRLFDGVSSMVFGIGAAGFDGAPAMQLEALCDEAEQEMATPLADWTLESHAHGLRLDWRPIVRQVVTDLQAELPASAIAMRFHRTIARAVTMVAERFPSYPIVLSGGCFQNRILTELVVSELTRQSRTVATPGTIPPNDGGLAAGQIAVAAAQLEAEERKGHDVFRRSW